MLASKWALISVPNWIIVCSILSALFKSCWSRYILDPTIDNCRVRLVTSLYLPSLQPLHSFRPLKNTFWQCNIDSGWTLDPGFFHSKTSSTVSELVKISFTLKLPITYNYFVTIFEVLVFMFYQINKMKY